MDLVSNVFPKIVVYKWVLVEKRGYPQFPYVWVVSLRPIYLGESQSVFTDVCGSVSKNVAHIISVAFYLFERDFH
jgi:hypothetical protein